jgi:hypothetical protein
MEFQHALLAVYEYQRSLVYIGVEAVVGSREVLFRELRDAATRVDSNSSERHLMLL